MSYLTRGLSWKADYVANLSAEGSAMDLNGWVTLTNASGIAYRGALVQLVAGEVNQVRWRPQARFSFHESETVIDAPKPQEESLDQHHLYTLSRSTDIGNNQTKQVALLSAPRVPVTRELVQRSSAYLTRSHFGEDWINLLVASRLRFLNQDGSLGMPLPKGSVRVYSKDIRGNAQFVGEDKIGHTPKGETVYLKLGESFDVTARRKQTSFEKLAGTSAYDYASEVGFEMELKNARPDPVTVKVIDELPGDWTMIESSQPHTKEAANLASWQVQIPAQGAVTLTWLVQARF